MTTTTLNGASVLLLGATGGLGRALGQELAARGAVLTLVGRDQQRASSGPEARAHRDRRERAIPCGGHSVA